MRQTLLIAILLLGGCSIYRMDIQQGNIIEPAKVAQLKNGLSHGEVMDLLGTPLITDPFHPDRWDYVYDHKPAYAKHERQRVTVFFDADDKLVKWEVVTNNPQK